MEKLLRTLPCICHLDELEIETKKIRFFSMIAGVPKGLSFSCLKASLLDIPGVLAVHDLHVWSLTVGTSAIAVHLVIGE